MFYQLCIRSLDVVLSYLYFELEVIWPRNCHYKERAFVLSPCFTHQFTLYSLRSNSRFFILLIHKDHLRKKSISISGESTYVLTVKVGIALN